MGGMLDKPVTEKETDRGTGRLGDGTVITYGASGMQGYRPEMEDQHTCEVAIPGLEGHSFFAVYDGHGGDLAAKVAAKEVLPAIQNQQAFKQYCQGGCKDPDLLGKAMEAGFIQCDNEMRPNLPPGDTSGTTAVSAFITPTHIICANAGDSRGIYCKGAVVALSEDHKPDNADERARIEKAGGHVAQGMAGMGPMRVDGDLAVSRCLGDFNYKLREDLPPEQQKVSPQPEIRVFKRDDAKDEVLILACDGIWDVMSNQECGDAVRQLLAEGERDMGLCAEELLMMCLDLGSKDNMSAIVVAFPAATYGPGPGVAQRMAARAQREAEAEAKEAAAAR